MPQPSVNHQLERLQALLNIAKLTKAHVDANPHLEVDTADHALEEVHPRVAKEEY